jgi:hypothetical protein
MSAILGSTSIFPPYTSEAMFQQRYDVESAISGFESMQLDEPALPDVQKNFLGFLRTYLSQTADDYSLEDLLNSLPDYLFYLSEYQNTDVVAIATPDIMHALQYEDNQISHALSQYSTTTRHAPQTECSMLYALVKRVTAKETIHAKAVGAFIAALERPLANRLLSWISKDKPEACDVANRLVLLASLLTYWNDNNVPDLQGAKRVEHFFMRALADNQMADVEQVLEVRRIRPKSPHYFVEIFYYYCLPEAKDRSFSLDSLQWAENLYGTKEELFLSLLSDAAQNSVSGKASVKQKLKNHFLRPEATAKTHLHAIRFLRFFDINEISTIFSRVQLGEPAISYEVERSVKSRAFYSCNKDKQVISLLQSQGNLVSARLVKNITHKAKKKPPQKLLAFNLQEGCD